MRPLLAALLVIAIGCGSGADVADRPAPPVGTASAPFTVSDADRAAFSAAAIALAPDPTGAAVMEIAPSYSNDGSVGQLVVELGFPPFSGTFDLPGTRLLEADGERYTQRVIRRYRVDGLRGLYVAVDAQSGDAVWADLSYTLTGSLDVIESVEVLSASPTDLKGRKIPANARRATSEH